MLGIVSSEGTEELLPFAKLLGEDAEILEPICAVPGRNDSGAMHHSMTQENQKHTKNTTICQEHLGVSGLGLFKVLHLCASMCLSKVFCDANFVCKQTFTIRSGNKRN